MTPGHSSRFRPSITLTAGTLTQLLAAVACFLGKFVLPQTVVELQGVDRNVLLILGFLMLTLGLANLLYGRHLSKLLSRAGKRSRVVIPREGIGYLAIMLTLAVGALLGQSNMPLLVFGMMAGPFVLNGAIVYHMLRGISVTRRMPRRAVCGDFVTVELEVSNRKRFLSSHMLEVRDDIEAMSGIWRAADQQGTVTLVRIPPRQRRTGRYQVAFAERGRYTIGPLRVSSRFPLGIGERGQLFDNKSELIVHPRLGRLLPAWTRRQKELAESSRRTRSPVGLFDDEFHRIREYRDGDNPRSIHWRSTARRGTIMTREFEQHRHADSLVLLDLSSNSQWTTDEAEAAISLAATICVEQTRSSSGGRFLLGIASDQPVVISSRSPGGFREEAMDALAQAQPSAKANLYDLLAKLCAEYSLNDERLILITPRPIDAAIAIESLNALSENSSLDLMGRTTIITASEAELNEVFRRDSDCSQAANFRNAAAADNSSNAGKLKSGEVLT